MTLAWRELNKYGNLIIIGGESRDLTQLSLTARQVSLQYSNKYNMN